MHHVTSKNYVKIIINWIFNPIIKNHKEIYRHGDLYDGADGRNEYGPA